MGVLALWWNGLPSLDWSCIAYWQIGNQLFVVRPHTTPHYPSVEFIL